ncbi:MAG TPA: hypothetical protein VFG20_15520, partial [Planctomycetaceae bacterium]|nr:hypothetical protein [Planctomycetaceae bacterium]
MIVVHFGCRPQAPSTGVPSQSAGRARFLSGPPFITTVSLLLLALCEATFAVDPDAVKLRDGIRKGDYATVIKAAAESIEKRVFGEEWY